MSSMLTSPHPWSAHGVTDEAIERTARWLEEDHVRFPSSLVMYFRTAAHCLRLTLHDYFLLPIVFSQTVIGFEKLLRLHFNDTEGNLPFKEMFRQAVQTKVIHDGLFPRQYQWSTTLREHFSELWEDGPFANQLAVVIPALRNHYLHGDYILTHDLLGLTIHVRQMVDAVAKQLPPAQTLPA